MFKTNLFYLTQGVQFQYPIIWPKFFYQLGVDEFNMISHCSETKGYLQIPHWLKARWQQESEAIAKAFKDRLVYQRVFECVFFKTMFLHVFFIS